jgi:integrase
MNDHTYGGGTIYQRAGSPFWWASYYTNGNGHKLSTRIRIADDPEQKAAERWLRKKQIATEAGTYVPSAARLTFEQMAQSLIDNWTVNGCRSMRSMRSAVTHLRRYFGDDKALGIVNPRIESYKAARLEEGAAPGTINHELAMLRRMFSLAKKANLIPNPPHIELLKLSNARQGFCDPADFARLLEALPQYLKGLVEFLYLTSWRPSEGRTLLVSDIDLSGRAIRLRAEHSKNGHARLVKLSGRLLEVIEQAMAQRSPGCQLLFHNEGHKLVDCRRSWATATKAAGLSGLLLYDLRRSGVRNMTRAGISESVAMKISGHLTRTVFDRYNITSESDLDAAAERLDAFLEMKKQEPAKIAVLAQRRAV